MAVDDVYQTDIFFTFQGDTNNIFTYHLKETNAPAGADSEDEINFFMVNVFIPDLLTNFSPDLVFDCSDTRRIWSGAQNSLVPSISRQLAMMLPGTSSPGESLPGQCSMLIQLMGDLDNPDPSRRGRDFYTGFIEGDQAAGVWTANASGDLTTDLKENLMDGVGTANGGQYQWIVFSHKFAKQEPQVDDPSTIINVLRALKHVRTQRRRQPTNPCDKYFAPVT